MKNKLFIAVPFFLIFVVSVFTYSCSCNCGKNSSTKSSVKGFITVVGDEVHTYLAIKADDNKTYILNCSKELNDLLIKNQGAYYYIQYDESTFVEKLEALLVKKAIPIKYEIK